MTIEEGDTLFDATQSFYKQYCKLVTDALDNVPTHLRDDLRDMLQDKSNVFSV